MTKRGKLSDLEKNTIFLLTREGYNTNEIASVLDRSEGVIIKYLNQTNIVDNPEPPTESKDSGELKAKDYLINRTSGKNEKAVSIMTREASERGDDHRLRVFEPSRLAKVAIHRIDKDGKKSN